MLSRRAHAVGKWLLIGIVGLVAIQILTWATYGRRQLLRELARSVALVQQGDLVVQDDPWESLGEGSSRRVLSFLENDGRRVWTITKLPSDKFEVLYTRPDGKLFRSFNGVTKLDVGPYTNTPVSGAFTFSVSRSPLAFKTYEFKYVWVLGFWKSLPTDNPIRIG